MLIAGLPCNVETDLAYFRPRSLQELICTLGDWFTAVLLSQAGHFVSLAEAVTVTNGRRRRPGRVPPCPRPSRRPREGPAWRRRPREGPAWRRRPGHRGRSGRCARPQQRG